MKKLTLLALLLCPQAQAQQHRLGMELGGTRTIRQDLIFSPNVHRSTSPLHVGLSWEKGETQALLLRFDLLQAQASPSFDYTHDGETQRTTAHSFLLAELAYRKAWAFVHLPRFQILGGFQVGAKVQALNYQYGRVGSFGYYFQTGLGPYLQSSYRWKSKNSLQLRAGQAAVAWVARSPYLVNDDAFIENISSHKAAAMLVDLAADGDLRTLLQFKDVEAEARYSRALTARWDSGLTYRFAYLNVEKARPLHAVQHGLFVNLAYKI